MKSERIKELHIERQDSSGRPRWFLKLLFILITLVIGAAAYYTQPWTKDKRKSAQDTVAGAPVSMGTLTTSESAFTETAPSISDDAVLTATGYIVNRERIELSSRILGVVKWVGVRKGDVVTNGQVVVLLDDAEYQAQLKEATGRLGAAQAMVDKAELDYKRVQELSADKVESEQALDHARIQLESARATVREVEGQQQLIQTYLDWTVIRSPINGIVLEKLVDPSEVATPQSFGGAYGPSTVLLALGDPSDLQVEVELNELDVAKVFLKQNCRVSPEAYPDLVYDGVVAEIAPEANRQKGTLEVKVQILEPDAHFTPELSARVDFLRE